MRSLSALIKTTVWQSLKEYWGGFHWLFNLLQLSAVCLAAFWWYRSPWPGYAIGVLAVVAAVMTVHGEMLAGHKAAE